MAQTKDVSHISIYSLQVGMAQGITCMRVVHERGMPSVRTALHRSCHVYVPCAAKCGVPSPCPSGCSQHGTCDVVSKSCTCDAGWLAGDCSLRDLKVVNMAPGFTIDYYATGECDACEASHARHVYHASPHACFVCHPCTDVPEARSMTLSAIPGLSVSGLHVIISSMYAVT